MEESKENLNASSYVCNFYTTKIEHLNEEKSQWQEKADIEKKERERMLNSLREERGEALDEFQVLQRRKAKLDREMESEQQAIKDRIYLEREKARQSLRIDESIKFL